MADFHLDDQGAAVRFKTLLRNPGDPRELPSDEVIGPDERDPHGEERELGDFAIGWSTVRLIPLAVVAGALSAVVALVLLKLIALSTSIAYFQRWGTSHASPLGHSMGWLAVLVPV